MANRRKAAGIASVVAIIAALLLLIAIASATATALRGCSKQPTPTDPSITTTIGTVTPTPTPKPSTSEEEASSWTEEALLARFGDVREFKATSTKVLTGERVGATGIFDAVTYDVKPEGLDGVVEEILSNPIYLSGVDQALREIGVVGESDWAKKFTSSYDPVTTEWWEQWVEKKDGKWYVTRDYFLIAARYAVIVQGLQHYRDVDKADVKVHFPLNVEMEVCYRSEKGEDYPFWVYQFVYKDGRVEYIGINKMDWRWAVIPPVPTPTPTSSPTPTPPVTTSTPTPTPPVSTTTPTPTPQPKDRGNDPVYRNDDNNAAADIGSPSNPENHDNNMSETPEPTSPGSYSNVATPTPKPTSAPTATPKPTSAPTATPKPTSAPRPTTTPPVESPVSGDGTNTGAAPSGDPG